MKRSIKSNFPSLLIIHASLPMYVSMSYFKKKSFWFPPSITPLWPFHNKGYTYTAAAAKSLQSCPTLCNPIDRSPPGSPVPGILQARTLEWVAVSFFNAWKWKVKVKSLSRVWLLATLWTAAYQAPPSMGFSRQEYWGGVPLPSLTHTHIYTIFITKNSIPLSHFSMPNYIQYF